MPHDVPRVAPTVAVDGSDVSLLGIAVAGKLQDHPVWSPDSRTIAFGVGAIGSPGWTPRRMT